MFKNALVTGIGILSPLGIKIDEHITALREGLIGITFNSSHNNLFPEIMGFVPEFNLKEFTKNNKSIKAMNRRTILGYLAAKLAFIDSKLDITNILETSTNAAVIFGAGVCEGILNIIDAVIPAIKEDEEIDYQKLCDLTYRNLPPLWILPKLPNTTAGQISIEYSIKGLNYSIVSGANSGMIAIGEAFVTVKDGRAIQIFCGGSEGEIYTDFFWRLKKRGLFSETENGSKSFGKESDGFLPAEGSCVLILEDEVIAKRRGMHGYGKILSYCNMYLPKFMDQDSSEISLSYERCMKKAISEAGLNFKNIDFIQAASCGFNKIDFAEAIAIRNTFANSPFITSCHPAIGNTLAASGAISTAYALLQFKNNFISPIVRTKEFFMDNELNYVKSSSIDHKSNFCLVNSFDYFGNACSIILGDS